MRFVLLSHFYNEELLLPSWCTHHRGIFDSALLVNHRSTDRSVEIIKEYWPEAVIWDSKLPQFDCFETDQEMMVYERLYEGPDSVKIILNTTEFIWHPDFKGAIGKAFAENPDKEALGMQSYCLVDNAPRRLRMPVYLGRHHGFLDKAYGFNVSRFRRFVHKAADGQYSTGRHSTTLPAVNIDNVHLLHLSFSPWPESLGRKLQIQTQMPDSDKQAGRGVQHITSRDEQNMKYAQYLSASDNLMKDEYFSAAYLHFYGKFAHV